MTVKIYVRERTKIGEGVRQPRFVVLAVAGGDLKVIMHHLLETGTGQTASDRGAGLHHRVHA
jgi:hypothetical protein